MNGTKSSTISSSAQSDFSSPVLNVDCINNEDRQFEEEIKASLPDDVLEVDEYDENGIAHRKVLRIDEENKYIVREWAIPPITNISNSKGKGYWFKDNASKITEFLENINESQLRKNSYDGGRLRNKRVNLYQYLQILKIFLFCIIILTYSLPVSFN